MHEISHKIMILIDGFHSGTGRGVGNYLDNILREFDQNDEVNKKIILLVRRGKDSENLTLKNIKVIRAPKFPFPIWENILIPLYCWALRPTILHSPCNSGPLLPTFTKRILTLHDVIFLHDKQKVEPSKDLYQRIGRIYLKINVRLLANFYYKILTVSDFSRHEIISELNVSPEKVFRIYEGSGSSLFTEKKKRTSEKYIIHFGSDDPRKNTLSTIAAFKKSLIALNGFRLKVVGDCNVNSIKKALNDYELNGVDFLGFISKDQLKEIANNSFCLCYCSTYEGFGMPIIEFQEIGIPVITSNKTSCKEICGEGGILVDPFSTNSITRALDSLYRSKGLKEDLVHAGYENIRRFSWKDCAQEIKMHYEV